MSVQIETVVFEQREAYLSELDDGAPWTVHGVALGAGDVTVGQSGIKKLWPAEELEKAAESLEGRNLVVDHDNDASGVVGTVTKAGYKEDVGVIYEAELFDEELAEKINNGLLEVSIRGKHIDVDAMDETEDGAKVVEGIKFDNLSIVPTGAAPSNTIEMGETEELSVAELAAFTDGLESAELQEIEPGMWVTDGDMHGITISAVEDGEVEVDIYEEMDGKWRSTGETEMVSTDGLSEWDVDEDDIGEMEDDSEDEEENASTSKDVPSQDAQPEHDPIDDDESEQEMDIPDKFFFESEDEAMDFIEDKDGLTGVHEMDGMFIPGDTHDEFMEWWDNQSSNSGHEEDEDDEKMSEHDFSEGQMVQWQVRPDMFGKIVHIDDEEGKIMVEVMEMTDGDMETTNHTVSAGFSDLVPMKEDEMAENTSITVEEMKEIAELRSEGEESVVGEDVTKDDIKNQSPERYPEGDRFDDEELQNYSMHTPEWSGTTEGEWDSPDMEDFDTDDLEEIASHFLISATGFPPENFGDLKLPVVEPNGDLNVNALSAVKGGRGVSAVEGLGSEMEERIINWVNDTANEEFDRDWGDEEEAGAHGMHKRPRTIDDTGEEPNVENTGPVDVSLDLINKYLRLEGKHERDSVDKMLSWLFGANDLPMETVSDFRTAANAFLNQTPGTDSFEGMTVEQFRDWLLMHGDGSKGRREQDTQERGELPPGFATPVHVLTGDDLQQGYKSEESELDDATLKVNNMTNEEIEQKLAELNEPVAVEQSDLEELQQKADRFEEMSETLESLKERTDILDEADREQVEELAEAEEPVVVESARYESLEEEAEQVKKVYAAELSKEWEAFSADELADRFSIEELREKYEEQIGDPAEELAGSEDAEPKSGDVDEEELEERAEAESEEELSNDEREAEDMRAELKDKILNRN